MVKSNLTQARKRDDVNMARPFGGLRVLFDTRYVNDERACRSVGQDALDEAGGAIKCAYEDVLTPAKAQFLLGVIKQASEFLSSALYVERRDMGVLRLQAVSDESSELCDRPGLAIPPDYIANGLFDVDLVIFVTTWPARRSVRGFAEPCLYDDVSGRPIAGYINFSPRKLDSVATSFPTAIHELFHVLGFKRGIFPTFRDPDYVELKESFILGMDVLTRETLVTTNAVARARAHFDCPTLVGVPLENKNGDPGDHWDKTALGDDLMTAALAPRFPPLSHVTLGALADSGWYRVDYRRSSTFLFGSRQGCSFLSQPCDMRISDGYAECVAPMSCAFDQRSYGSCPNSSVYAGRCLIPDTSVSCFDGVDPSTGAVLDSADAVGPEMRCFMNKPAGGSLRANCLRHRCSGGTLSVEIGNSWYMCSEAARIVSTANGGELQCPASGDLCCTCSGSAICLRGRCACSAGFEGANCSEQLPLPIGSLAEVVPPVELKPANPIVDVPSMVGGAGALELPAIIGIAVGGVVCMILCFVILALFVRSRRQRQLDDAASAVLGGRGITTVGSGRRGRAQTPPDTEPWDPSRSGMQPTLSRGRNSPMHSAVHSGIHDDIAFQTVRNNGSSNGFGTVSRNASQHHQQQQQRNNQMRQRPLNISRESKMGVSSKMMRMSTAVGGVAVATLFKATALWDCAPDEHDELAFHEGDVLDVLDDADPEWWVCRLRDTVGTAPSTYLVRQ